ncbi:MAG TPA: PIN domain nuclease [Planctomycetota bacterium]|nr:PIN domain nuclease [Planctomycetota bacterium]
MLIVDTNVWASYFNGAKTPHVDRLEQALSAEEDLAVLPIIVTETLQGFRTERAFLTAKDLLLGLPVIEPSIQTHVAAAILFRGLRARGVTIRGAIDCIIAQACIEQDAELLSPDADFRRIARHAPLRLCEVQSA